MVKTDKYGRLPAKLEQDVKKWMSLHANEHENSTSLAEEAASVFGLYEDTVDYTIPEIVFELSLKACEDAGITESDDGETVHHGAHKKGACDACKEYSPSLDSQGLCPECAHDLLGDESIDEAGVVPCECGSKDATWHGDEYGSRIYMCDKCWKKHSLTEAAEEESSRAIDKIATKIMDKLQSFQIRAGYTNSTVEQKKAAVKYAAEVLPKMKELKARIEKSDDPGSAYLYDGFISRLERQANKKLDEQSFKKKVTEVMNKLVSDKQVIDAFLDKKSAESKKLSTDGTRLDGSWLGGSGIAEWIGDKIKFNDLGSKAAQTIQRAIKKAAPKNWLGESKELKEASGYTDCPCRDCFETAFDGKLCPLCSEAGCDEEGHSECNVLPDDLEENRMKLKEDDIFNKISNKDLASLEDEAWQLKTSMMSMLGDFSKKCKATSKMLVGLKDKLAAQALMKDANAATTMIAKELFPSTHMDTISMSSIKTEGESELVEADTTIDKHALEELELYMDNESSIYNQKKSIIKNLQRKMDSGKYDHSLAPKMWAYWVESGAKAYAKEFDSPTNWNKLFPKPLRDALAIKIADYERDAIKRGEYDETPVKSGKEWDDLKKQFEEDEHVVSKGEDTADVLLDEAPEDYSDEEVSDSGLDVEIMEGMSKALWATAWADHVEEHGCESLSGVELTEVMPIVPDAADRMAVDLSTQFSKLNGRKGLSELYKEAMKADEAEGRKQGSPEEFGSDLAMQAMGHGVSWFDDHAEFPIKFPSIDNFDLRIKADEDCEEDGTSEIEESDKEVTYVVSAKVNGYSKMGTVMASSIADAKDKGAEKLGADPSTVRAKKRDS